MSEEIESLKKQQDNEIAKLKKEKYMLEAENQMLKQQIEQREEAYAQEKEVLCDELDKLRQMRDDREESVTRLQEASPFVYEDVKNYKQEIEHLQNALHTQSDEKHNIKAEMSGKLESSESEIQRLKQEIEQIKKQQGENDIEMIVMPDSNGKDEDVKDSEDVPLLHNYKNGWSNDTEHILLGWKLSTTKMMFIYGFILNKYKTRLENFLIWSFICSTLSTFLAGTCALLLGVYIERSAIMWLTFGISMLMLFTDGISATLNGIMTIKKYPEYTTSLSSYKQKLNDFYAIISSQYMLPTRLRSDGDTFIRKENEVRTELVQEAPGIELEDYEAGHSKFEEFSSQCV
jgi:hypothetical protein